MKVPTLDAPAWNALVAELARNQILDVRAVEGGGSRHPWQTSIAWNGERWAATIEPGFVNALDAAVRIRPAAAPAETIERLRRANVAPEPGPGEIDAFLCEGPSIPLTAWRELGPASAPTGASVTDDGLVSLNYEPVPAFFKALGVGAPPTAEQIARGIVIAENARRLVSLDLVLYQPRAASRSEWETSSTPAEGTIATFSIVNDPPPADPRPYVRQVPRFAAAARADALARLSGGWSDTPRDEIHLAELYLVSPPGAGLGAEIGPTWAPYVRHRLFWNLSHATNLARPPANQIQTFQTGLAAGVGDALIGFILSQVNDPLSAAMQFLNSSQLGGKFWTV